MTRISLGDPRFYLNRHLQWLAFNHRVLEEARDPGNPLLERVKFLAITANNLDEFVEIRVSSFLQKIEHGGQSISPDGLTPSEELDRVSASMHQFVREQYKCWNDELVPASSSSPPGPSPRSIPKSRPMAATSSTAIRAVRMITPWSAASIPSRPSVHLAVTRVR